MKHEPMREKIANIAGSVKKRLGGKSLQRTLSVVLSVAVALGTVYSLVRPAVTLEADETDLINAEQQEQQEQQPQQESVYYCGMEAHVHTDECYEEGFTCGKEETDAPAHTHTDECFEEQNVLTCTLVEGDGHRHSDECYGEAPLQCGQEETEGHAHTDECYEEQKKLSCGFEEDETHSHGETCYTAERVLVCGREEAEAHAHSETCYGEKPLVCGRQEQEAHTHAAECYEPQQVAVCGQEESEGPHTHDETCQGKALLCQKEEHVHTLACQSNPEADVEGEMTWLQSIPAELSGTAAERVFAVAASQVGYRESEKNYSVDADGATKHGYTRYGAWAGSPYAADWDNQFVSFCLYYAKIPQESFPRAVSRENWMEQLRATGLWRDADRSVAVMSAAANDEEGGEEPAGPYTPKSGDAVFFDTNEDGKVDRIGLVKAASADGVTVISGNDGGAVTEKLVPLASVLGYGVMPLATPEEEPEGQLDTLKLTVTTDPGGYHDPIVGEDGTLLYYTGEKAGTTLTISNPTGSEIEEDDGAVVRLYMKFTPDTPTEGVAAVNAPGAPAMAPGNYTIKAPSGKEYRYTVTKIEGTETYCFEVERPIQGETISLELPSAYPSPTSMGGTNEVWGVVLTKEQKEALDADAPGGIGIAEKPADGSNQQKMRWETVPDEFKVTKTQTGTLELEGDSETGAYFKGLNYKIKHERVSEHFERIGKDLVESVDFVDVLTLPEGGSLREEIEQAIRDKTYTLKEDRRTSSSSSEPYWYLFFRLGNEEFLTMNTVPRYVEGSASLSLRDDGKLELRWKADNPSRTGETVTEEWSAYEMDIKIGNRVVRIDKPQEGVAYQITNDVTSTEHHSWSADQVHQGQAVDEVGSGDASLELTKSAGNVSVMGDAGHFIINAKNPGVLSYREMGFVEDALPTEYYCSPLELAIMFANETTGKYLNVTITNSAICQPVPMEAGLRNDGTTEVLRSIQDSSADAPGKYNGMSSSDPTEIVRGATLTMTWAEDGKIRVTRQAIDPLEEAFVLCEPTETGIQDAFNQLGHTVVSNTRFTLQWDLRGEDGKGYMLKGGTTLSFMVRTRAKTSFMLLEQDTPTQFPNYYRTSMNYARAYGLRELEDGTTEKGDLLKTATAQNKYTVDRDYTIQKGATTADGKELKAAPAEGETINYQLDLNRRNPVYQYEAFIPVVDRMSGGQVLLVPVEKNQSAEWAASLTEDDIFTDTDGTRYYKLTKPGVYRNVCFASAKQRSYTTVYDFYADSVTVTDSGSGRDTLIKVNWDIRINTSYLSVKYKSLVCPSEVAEGQSVYSIGNEGWIGDRQGHRLYTNVPTVLGSTFDFAKKIVDPSDLEAADKTPGAAESAVAEGQTVYYRVEIDAGAGKFSFTGNDLYDALPAGISSDDGTQLLRWKKGTADAASAQPGDVWVEKYENIDGLQNPTHWDVRDDGNDQQVLYWEEDFAGQTNGQKGYLYIRLTYPTGEAWQQYAAKFGGTGLTNTFYLLNVPSAARHTLKIGAKVRLQKGVAASQIYRDEGGTRVYPNTPKNKADVLQFYSNNDAHCYGVIYYAVLTNDGSTRLYLSDLQDVLPKGFTFKSMLYPSNTSESFAWSHPTEGRTQEMSGQLGYLNIGDNYTWKRVGVSAAVDKNDPQKVSFHFQSSARGNTADASYDEERGMYYLNPGEATGFLYGCSTNKYADTLDVAVNSIAMPYYDYNKGGVSVSDVKISTTRQYYTPNDGSCTLLDNAQAEALGMTGGTEETQWLESNVRQMRDDVKPGVSKVLASATSKSGVTTANPLAVHPTDTLNWEVTAHNDGNSSLQDYILTDTMQAPYSFAGTDDAPAKVNYTIYMDWSDYSKTNVYGMAYQGTLFTIGAIKDGKVTISGMRYSYRPADVKELTINGDPVTIKTEWLKNETSSYPYMMNISVQITRDAKNGNYTLSVRFPDALATIPAGGRGVLSIPTQNPENSLENKVYVNTCFITPVLQAEKWDNTTSHGNVTTMDVQGYKDMSSVRNSAAVTSTYGYTTSSLKYVQQTDNAANKADSASSTGVNYIILPDKTKGFTYTLRVDNAQKDMREIILIDNLPEVGDHTTFEADDLRFSEFNVSLADDPAVKVWVKLKNGTENVLDPSQYTLEYSTRTEFTKEDWRGTSAWTDTAAVARSLRLRITDTEETGELMPAESSIYISFNAVINGDADPGQIAWNSFGYHYSILENSAELEAAPLKVGVMIPGVPTLEKKLVNGKNRPIGATEDKLFRFVCYKGASLGLWEEAALGEALTANGREATLLEVPVVKGAESARLPLHRLKVYTYENGVWTATETNWDWLADAQYTIVELPDADPIYSFQSMNRNSNRGGFSFYYRSDVPLSLTAVNLIDVWDFSITKTNFKGTRLLPGAWFGLYSPNPGDQMTTEQFGQLEEHPLEMPAATVEFEGKTWYLYRVAKTSEAEETFGKLTFDNIWADEYLYREVQSPKGYLLDETMRTVKKTDAAHDVVVANQSIEYEIPETGGLGTALFTAAGLLLLAAAFGGWMVQRRKKRV